MALTGTERASIRRYLGYPARFHEWDTILEQAMNALDGTDDEAVVRTELARCAAIDAELDALDGSIQDVVNAGSTIRLSPAQQLSVIRSRGRQAVARLSALFAVPIRSDAFGTGGYSTLANYAG